ncbi:cation diffusion facilitator family transporter [Georgenia satyanarayanai]|uniref:cation diffusion facilitator family transporter n=1 Tax=Georgenia satyanarayanai TaxID=860221 RepID=UPI002040DF5A|nr:cation diffusion facilitator family transporter [Georgenia satyanarayanai]MCM3661410.1 cation diffusion facilitator family transporter [Georgenia satyanarayanai]
MGAGHSHAPVIGHAGGRHRRRLAGAFALTAGFFLIELVAGLVSGSLALLSDAGHMAADVVVLGAALVATRIASRPDRTGRRTYGSYRAEVFASALAVLVMLAVGVYVVVEAISRLGDAPEVASGAMLAVGFAGLVINVASMLLLRSGSKESLNVKGAYYEVIADAAGSVGVMVAGVLIILTGQPVWDVVVAGLIAVFVIIRALVLGRQVVAVLAQHAPDGIDPDGVAAALSAVPGVADVHDLHLWTLTSGMNVATAHLTADHGADHGVVLSDARDVLRDRYGIAHATLQVEAVGSGGCHDLSW